MNNKPRVTDVGFTASDRMYVTLEGCGDFSLRKTFDCGQTFRFEAADANTVEGVALGRLLRLTQTEDGSIEINCTLEEFEGVWKHYLALDRDYGKINRYFSEGNDEVLKKASLYGKGIHILRQDPWEALCSFIISQNNNIPRIKKIIAAMSEKYGESLGGGNYAFPTAKALNTAGESEIFALKTGFRAKYIADAAARVCDGRLDLDTLDGDTDECAKKLCEVKGIGPKVALCSLLFGFGKLDAFPVDVWIRRVMEKYFREGFTPAELGPYAGIAQQYLFYYERYIVNK